MKREQPSRAKEYAAETAAAEADVERHDIAALNSSVGLALVRGDTLREILQRCAEALVTHLDAAFARVWTLDEGANVLELQASAGLYTHLDGPHARVPVGQFKIGLIAEERRPHLTNSVVGDQRVGDQEWAKREGMVAFAGYPLVIEDRLVGVIALFARHPLGPRALAAMAAVANVVALGIGHKRREEELRRGEELNQAVINSLTAHIAVLDRGGRIVAVNDAWRRFADENGGAGTSVGVGVNYLKFCGEAAGGDAESRRILRGIEAVLAGEREEFQMEYPCHSSDEERWFLLHVSPLRLGRGGAVVSHINITERKRAEQALKALNQERERMLEEVSTPLVPVLEGVLVMPLIGSLDTARMQRATQAALAEVSRTGARACIIDITGARIIDSQAVANLSNLVLALRLTGAEAVVTGVSAHAAQSIVGLGLDLGGLRTHRTLAQALSSLLGERIS
ncbi:MAG TPA: GAF domain-containing protein [Pyrinomonadaceae bacterium]|nr:GAF domain-containing protein [Pyrinomonadaceae bacterium]